MKTLRILLLVSIVVFTSCNSNDTGSNSTSKDVLVKKITVTDPTTNEISNIVFTYNGNKIVNMGSSTYKIVFTYAGNLITKIQSFDEQNELQSNAIYDYKDGKLDAVTDLTDSPHINKTTYSYNSDRSVDYVSLETNPETNQLEEYDSGKLTFSNGNLINNTNNNRTITYEYDSKNNPFKNVIGLNLLLDYYPDLASTNNFIKQTETNTYGNSYITIAEYIYNSNAFPKEQKNYNEGNLESTIQYFY